MKYTQPVGAAASAPYVDANPAAGIEGSPVPAAAVEHPQREIEYVITEGGLVPSAADLTQLAQAIKALIAASRVDISDLVAKADMPDYGTYTQREVVASSGPYVAPVEGWYRVTAIGGGGGGGKGGSYSASLAQGGAGGGTTSFGTHIAAVGGGGGGGGGGGW